MPEVKSRKKRTRRKRPAVEDCDFAIEIKDWEVSYGVRLDEGRHEQPAYRDSLHLEIRGIILEPDNYAGQELKATFIGNRDVLDLPNPGMTNWKPLGVGTLNLRGERRDFLGSLPLDCFHTIVFLLQAERIRYVRLWGPKAQRGSSNIKSISFDRDHDPEE